jgi:hypothetical protein
MKNTITSILLSFLCADLCAQSAFSNNTSASLEKVIQDYPNRFKNIKGEVIVENPQTTEYQSKVQLAGASPCVVTRYSSTKNDVYSWGCTIIKTEDFNTAKNKFREVFAQIKNSIIKPRDGKPFILNGQYEAPSEEKKFTTIIFELIPAVGEMKKVKVDLSLQYEVTEWRLSLTVYDRDRKDDESGIVSGN